MVPWKELFNINTKGNITRKGLCLRVRVLYYGHRGGRIRLIENSKHFMSHNINQHKVQRLVTIFFKLLHFKWYLEIAYFRSKYLFTNFLEVRLENYEQILWIESLTVNIIYSNFYASTACSLHYNSGCTCFWSRS